MTRIQQLFLTVTLIIYIITALCLAIDNHLPNNSGLHNITQSVIILLYLFMYITFAGIFLAQNISYLTKNQIFRLGDNIITKKSRFMCSLSFTIIKVNQYFITFCDIINQPKVIKWFLICSNFSQVVKPKKKALIQYFLFFIYNPYLSFLSKNLSKKAIIQLMIRIQIFVIISSSVVVYFGYYIKSKMSILFFSFLNKP